MAVVQAEKSIATCGSAPAGAAGDRSEQTKTAHVALS